MTQPGILAQPTWLLVRRPLEIIQRPTIKLDWIMNNNDVPHETRQSVVSGSQRQSQTRDDVEKQLITRAVSKDQTTYPR